MREYYERPCRATIRYTNGTTRTLRVNYGFRLKPNMKWAIVYSASTGKIIARLDYSNKKDRAK